VLDWYIFILILYIYIIPKNIVGIALAPIYYYSAPEGKHLQPTASSHPIEAKGMKSILVLYAWSES
jgi:hypothetical protein